MAQHQIGRQVTVTADALGLHQSKGVIHSVLHPEGPAWPALYVVKVDNRFVAAYDDHPDLDGWLDITQTYKPLSC
jgi:hypothetical protein